jgi:hypothetical protein
MGKNPMENKLIYLFFFLLLFKFSLKFTGTTSGTRFRPCSVLSLKKGKEKKKCNNLRLLPLFQGVVSTRRHRRRRSSPCSTSTSNTSGNSHFRRYIKLFEK